MDNILIHTGGVIDMEHLEVVRFYLFGDVRFLDFLLVLMAIDIITGIFKAIKNHNLWSRKSLFGYARKLLIFGVIIVANIMDQVLGLNGVLTYSAVIFYIANEILSITENLAEVGVLVPQGIAEKLKVMQGQTTKISTEIKEELTGSKVDKELEKTEGGDKK